MADDLCSSCGWVLAAGAVACPACGARLSEGASGYDTVFFPEAAASGASGVGDGAGAGTSLLHEDAAATDAAQIKLKRKAHLVRQGGTSSGQRLPVTCPKTIIGRDHGEVRIDDPTLSNRHFMIEEYGQEFFLRDLDSTNGTFLNGHLVRSAPLSSGDEIRAGESVFVFSVLEVIPCD